jgi:hypothetical protein
LNGIALKEQDETRIGLETDVLESGADLLQDGTSHRREEGTHITGVRVHLMNAFCFSVNGILISNLALFIQYVITVIQPRPHNIVMNVRHRGFEILVFQGTSLCLATGSLAGNSIPSNPAP